MHQPISDPPIHVLYVVDDASAATAERVARAADRLSIRRVATADEALAALDADRPVDCVVSDTRPPVDPLGAVEAVRGVDAELPVLLHLDSPSDVSVGDALDAGATDCLRHVPDAGHDLLAHRIHDAVASRRTERRLHSQHSQYRRLFDDAPVMFVVFRSVDDEPVIEDCNDRFLDRLGYDRDALVDRSVWDLYANESMERAVDGFDSGRRGTFGQQERTLVAADGERVETIFRASPRFDQYGDVIGTVGLYVDITERKRRERTLERLHDVTRNLLRAETETAVAEIVVDAVRDVLDYPTNLVRLVDEDELRSVAITDAAEQLLGGRPVYSVGEGTAGRAFAAGETVIYDDVRSVDDDYDRHDVRASMFVPIADHGVLSVGDTEVGTFDRSDRHLAELVAANAATALTLLDRTQDLERQNDRLAEFASVVSHDLRTPLAVVDGSLELAAERYDDDDDIDRAMRSLGRAFDLIEDLLTLTRRNDDPDPLPVDLSAVAEACWRTVDTADATLVVEGTPTIRADESRLRRVLENLFRNSVEHGSTGSRPGADDSVEHGSTSNRPEAGDSVEHSSTGSRPQADDGEGSEIPRADGEAVDSDEHGSPADTLTITLGRLPDSDGFYVADDGPGLPDDDVFEAGYSTTEDGTGLGLAIVERIAREHGWSVAAVDADNGGARFEFRV